MSVAWMKDVDVYIHVGQISPITAYHKESHISMLQDSHDNLFIIYILTISSYIIIIQLQTRQFMNKTTPTHRHIVTRHLFNLRWAKLRTSHQAPAAASKEPWSCGLVFLGQRHVDPSTMEIHSAIHIGRSKGVVDQLFFSLKWLMLILHWYFRRGRTGTKQML